MISATLLCAALAAWATWPSSEDRGEAPTAAATQAPDPVTHTAPEVVPSAQHDSGVPVRKPVPSRSAAPRRVRPPVEVEPTQPPSHSERPSTPVPSPSHVSVRPSSTPTPRPSHVTTTADLAALIHIPRYTGMDAFAQNIADTGVLSVGPYATAAATHGTASEAASYFRSQDLNQYSKMGIGLSGDYWVIVLNY